MEMRMEVETFKAIRVLVERGIGRDMNIGYYLMFENAEDMVVYKKLLDKIKDWGAIKLSEYYLIEYSVSKRIPNAIWVRKVNRAGKSEDMSWSDIDRLMEMVEEEYKKVSKVERRHYVITPYSDDISWEEVA